jgi:hypothetical protein
VFGVSFVSMSYMCFYDVAFADIPFELSEMYALMGYSGKYKPDSEVQAIIDDMLFVMSDVCKPRIGYKIVNGQVIDKEHINIDGGGGGGVLLSTGRIITYAMHEAEKFAIFTATAGGEFDAWLKAVEHEYDIVKTYLANTLGSVIAEAAVSLLMRRLEADCAAQGLKVSNSYSPGYCDWLLVEQKKLLSVLDGENTGITLTPSCMMLPVKSVSGIAGAGKNVKKRPYGCAICKMKNCIRNKNQQ